jgi:hypothetical protein
LLTPEPAGCCPARRREGGQTVWHAPAQGTAALLLVSVYSVRPWESTRIAPNFELFAVWTAAGEPPAVLVGALVVLVLEVVEDDPQAAAIAAAGTSPSRMALREGLQCRR